METNNVTQETDKGLNIYNIDKKDIKNIDFSIFFQDVPKSVRMVSAILKHAGHEAYLVGGCVRDRIMGKIPNDYDFCTNATPEQIIELFPRTFYENVYGTVGVVTIPEEEAEKLAKEKLEKSLNSVTQETFDIKTIQKNEVRELFIYSKEDINKEIEKITKASIVEITPYRLESVYSDGRRPDSVKWSKKVEDDLKRRDFTCNALAYDITTGTIIDNFDGIKDIKDRTLRCVGDADTRLGEDSLRMLRAVRFSAQLNFKIDNVTRESIKKNEYKLKNISRERVRDEFSKIIMSPKPKEAIELAHDLGLLKYVSHEIESGLGIRQNQAHSFDVWEHNLRTCQHAADKGWPLELRLSALFHDVSKPETRRFNKEKNDYTFYGHDVVGGRVSREILERLKYPKDTVDYVSSMVRWHMFFSDTEQISLSAVRRLISNVGKDRVWDLMDLRICDRVGTGRPKENPYRFRMYKSMVEQAMTDPVTLKMMKINGERIMGVTQEMPGPKIGLILNALFSEILEDPSKNTAEYLENRALHMKSLDVKELKIMADSGKEVMQEKNADQVASIRKKFHVK
jgi:tRNA nucleotidyltransferase (CCA-adding enzyme)